MKIKTKNIKSREFVSGWYFFWFPFFFSRLFILLVAFVSFLLSCLRTSFSSQSEELFGYLPLISCLSVVRRMAEDKGSFAVFPNKGEQWEKQPVSISFGCYTWHTTEIVQLRFFLILLTLVLVNTVATDTITSAIIGKS
jgi:hypothetical protein